MSWEMHYPRTGPCPCGKSILSMTCRSDDWGRIEYGPVVIECPDCAKKWHVEYSASGAAVPRCEQRCTIYLTPNDYPDYDGPSEMASFGCKPFVYSMPFDEYLMSTRTLGSLVEARDELEYVRNCSKVEGAALRIVHDHKKRFRSAKCKDVLAMIESAIERYSLYEGTEERRAVVREEERKCRTAYMAEKRKHQFLVNL